MPPFDVEFEPYFDIPEPAPEQDDFPHREWLCTNCGAYNSHLDAECQWCGPEVEMDWDAIRADRIIDHRKNDR